MIEKYFAIRAIHSKIKQQAFRELCIINDLGLFDWDFDLEDTTLFSYLDTWTDTSHGLVNGCFDVLHSGHINHLKEASEKVKYLFVAITADAFIDKGIGRPIFNEYERAYMVKSIVPDAIVFINRDNNALRIIEALKPDFYFKGYDYKNGDDLHGALEAEIKAVESVGGKIYYTSDKIMSSTTSIIKKLKGEHDDSFSTKFKDELALLREKGGIGYLKQIFESSSSIEYAVLGEQIVDKYCYAVPNGIANKSPIISYRVDCNKEDVYEGGARMIKNHLLGLSNYSVAGFDGSEELIEKKRYINKDNNQKVIEFVSCRDDIEKYYSKYKLNIFSRADNFVIADFGHGFFNRNTMVQLNELINRENLSKDFLHQSNIHLMAQTNSSNYGFNVLDKWEKFSKVQKIKHVSLDMREGQLLTRNKNADANEIIQKVISTLNPEYIVLTRGREGLTLYHNKNYYEVPSVNNESVDTIGCGDAVYAMTVKCIQENVEPKLIAFLANLAGWFHAQVIGNAEHLSRYKFYEFLKTYL